MAGYLSATHRRIGWWQALNPAIYLISLLPGIAVGVFLFPDQSSLWRLAGATLGVVFIQHGINLLNDAMDWVRGADVEKYNSWVRFHDLNPVRARYHGLFSLAIGLILGILILYLSHRLAILLLAVPLVALGYSYNLGAKPVAYSGYSEWVTGLCYGPGVFGCLWLLGGAPNAAAGISGSLAFAALAVAVLLSHQPEQVLTDAMVGKRSFAVRYGVTATRRMVVLLTLISFFALDSAFFAVNPQTLVWSLVSTVGVTCGLGAYGRWNPPSLLVAALVKLLWLSLLTWMGLP